MAEEGADLATWAPKRGRPSLDTTDSEPSPRIAVRIPRMLHRRVSARAAKEGRTVSEVVRDLLAGYAAQPADLQSAALPILDRSEIRRAIRMSDAEREAYFLASNRNMLRMFADAHRSG